MSAILVLTRKGEGPHRATTLCPQGHECRHMPGEAKLNAGLFLVATKLGLKNFKGDA